jgi:hypothetical protein
VIVSSILVIAAVLGGGSRMRLGMAEHPAYLLVAGAVLEPVPDLADGGRLRRRRSEVGHAALAPTR